MKFQYINVVRASVLKSKKLFFFFDIDSYKCSRYRDKSSKILLDGAP